MPCLRGDTSGCYFLAWRLADRRIVPIAAYDKGVGNGISISLDERHALLTRRDHLILDLMLLDGIELSPY